MSHHPVRHLSFVANDEHASAIASRFSKRGGNQTVICLDEALFPVEKISKLFPSETQILGLSALNMSGQAIVDEAVELTERLFPKREDDPISRVERWMLESIRRWLVYAVHSVRLVEEAFQRFEPDQVWIPPYPQMQLTISPDVFEANPLFFDLLPALTRRAGLQVKLSSGRKSERLRRLSPIKFVIGQWLSSLRKSVAQDGPATELRPILVSNLDNDLHRQFDLSKMNSVAEQTFAWLRDGDQIVPMEVFLEKVEAPATTGHAWLHQRKLELDGNSWPAGSRVKPLAGLRFLSQLARSERDQYQRRKAVRDRTGLSWWDLLFGSELPYIHRECRLAGAFYCVYEYERTRAVLQKWLPQLFVICNFWTDLPKLDAANDLGITSLMTSAGINFIENDFAERIAPIVCVYGDSEERKTLKTTPAVTVIQAGDALVSAREDLVSTYEPQSRRMLLATSGRMFGWWFGSLIFDYKVFDQTLRAFAAKVRQESEPVSVVIKSHPVSDLHELYERLIREEGDVFVEHRKSPISEQDLSQFDAAVLFSAATTFLAELIRARVPVIYFDGALTKFGKSYFDYNGLALASNVEDLYSQLRPLMKWQRDARASVLRQSDSFLAGYINPDARPFSSVIEEIFERGLVRARHATKNKPMEIVEPVRSFPGASSLKP